MEFIGDIARKTGDPLLLAVEALKSEKAAQIGRDSGLFYVPTIVRFDEKNGQLDFERLHSLVTLAQLAIDGDSRLFSLLGQTGQALATIHKRLVLPEQFRVDLPVEWMDAEQDNVFIHGDLATINVCYHGPTGNLVMLDWSAAPLLGRRATYGSRYFDVLWFASCLFHSAPYDRLFSWKAESMADAFLRGYAKTISAGKFSRFERYVPAIRRLQRKNMWYLARRRRPLKAAGYLSYQTLMYVRLLLFLHKYVP
jgi:hypothetical protein